MSKRKRKRTSVKNRINGAANNEGLGGVSKPSQPTPEFERVPATDAAWEAGQLHEARADNCELRQKLLEQEQLIIKKDQLIIALRQKVHDNDLKALETKRTEVNDANTKLREDYGLVVGRQLKKDPKTGEVYWLVARSEEQK